MQQTYSLYYDTITYIYFVYYFICLPNVYIKVYRIYKAKYLLFGWGCAVSIGFLHRHKMLRSFKKCLCIAIRH